MGAAMSHPRKARKSMPARLDGSATQAKITGTAQASTPKSSRRSRLAAHTGAKITKAPPAAKSRSTPAVSTKASKAQSNGTAKASTPAKQPATPTPNNNTRSTRRDRKSTAASTSEQTTSNTNKGTESAKTPVTHGKEQERPQSQRSDKPRLSRTVALNVGRKQLESFLAENQQRTPDSHEIPDSVEHSPVPAPTESFPFEYDTEMYRNNFGLDGQTDTPTSPTSLSTTTSTAARTSGRTRKPTMKALESQESEKRFRRTRATSSKPTSSNGDNASTAKTPATGAKTRSRKKPGQQPATPAPEPPKLDLVVIGRQIYDLSAAAVKPDFVPAPEAEMWFKQLRGEFDQTQKAKEAEAAQLAQGREGAGAEAGESMPVSNQPSVLDIVQVSEPWTDQDGWLHTGQVNKSGDEYVVIPAGYEWYRPNNTYGDDALPQPPVRVRSLEQAEKDRVFGFPPRIGERNVPLDVKRPFRFENVNEEKAKIKAREAAIERGIAINWYMSLAELEALIFQHDAGQPLPTESSAAANEPKGRTRKRRRAETTDTKKPSEPETTQRRKRQRKSTVADSAPASTPDETAAPSKATTAEPTDAATAGQSKESTAASRGAQTEGGCRLKLLVKSPEQIARERAEAAAREAAAKESAKRPHSETEDSADNQDAPSPKKQKLSTTGTKTQSATAPLRSTPEAGRAQTENAGAPAQTSAPDQQLPSQTPSGRPVRRAAAALMAGFQHHAEERARRANARKKSISAKKAATPNPRN